MRAAGCGEALATASKGYLVGVQLLAVIVIVAWTQAWIGGLCAWPRTTL